MEPRLVHRYQQSDLENPLLKYLLLLPVGSVGAFTIFVDAIHGRSFNRLSSQIFEYGGPTLVIVRTTKKELFGAYVTIPWNSKAVYREDYACFLFSILPTMNTFRCAIHRYISLILC